MCCSNSDHEKSSLLIELTVYKMTCPKNLHKRTFVCILACRFYTLNHGDLHCIIYNIYKII